MEEEADPALSPRAQTSLGVLKSVDRETPGAITSNEGQC